MSHHPLQSHQSPFLPLLHKHTRTYCNAHMKKGGDTGHPLANRKCVRSKIKFCLCLYGNSLTLKTKQNCSSCYSIKPCANSAHSAACWFQGTQLISQHYNQARAFPVGWLQEGHSDSHGTASWKVKSRPFSAECVKNMPGQVEPQEPQNRNE